jgi:hypothetical protein
MTVWRRYFQTAYGGCHNDCEYDSTFYDWYINARLNNDFSNEVIMIVKRYKRV